MSASAVDSGCEQCLADEVDQGACGVDRQQDAENLQNRQRLLVEVLQVEQPCPEQFLGCGIVGDQVHGERGCVIRLMARLWKVTRPNSRNMPKPTMMTGNRQSPVMYIPMSCLSSDNVMEAQVCNRKNRARYRSSARPAWW